MPENLYFRQPQTQEILLDILFVWAKLNEDISYRQGMHEILAPILWVVERDAVDSQDSDSVAASLFSSAYIAHDTFTLFGLVMQNHKSSYALATSRAISSSHSRPPAEAESPMVVRSRHIMNVLLAKVDPEVANYLQKADIVPQVFLIRWIRLLFGREFSFDNVLELWDWLFTMDASLQCVDLICVAMLLRIRWQLVEADVDHVLPLLLRYPEVPADVSAASFVDDALYLRNHLDAVGGAHIISKHTSRSPPVVRMVSPAPRATSDESKLMGQSPPQRTFSPFATPSRIMLESGGFEAVLQDAARGIYSRGEKWGVNKAVRDAVGEVRKNVQTLQTRSNTPAGLDVPVSGAIKQESQRSTSSEDLPQKLDELETRNKALARMLQSATVDLWKQQDESPADDEKTKLFTMAVASVQLVQVYLEDSSLQLPVDEAPANAAFRDEHAESTSIQPSAVPSDVKQFAKGMSNLPLPGEPFSETTANSVSQQKASERSPAPTTPPRKRTNRLQAASVITTKVPTDLAPSVNKAPASNVSPRPSLQSSYSWMLGQGDSDGVDTRSLPLSRSLFGESPYATSSPHSTSPTAKVSSNASRASLAARPSARPSTSFLFGDVGDPAPAAASRLGSTVHHVEPEKGHKRTDSKARRTVSSMLDETEDGDDIFRLGTMKR